METSSPERGRCYCGDEHARYTLHFPLYFCEKGQYREQCVASTAYRLQKSPTAAIPMRCVKQRRCACLRETTQRISETETRPESEHEATGRSRDCEPKRSQPVNREHPKIHPPLLSNASLSPRTKPLSRVTFPIQKSAHKRSGPRKLLGNHVRNTANHLHGSREREVSHSKEMSCNNAAALASSVSVSVTSG